MGERAGLLANKITASKDLRYEQAQKLIKFDEIVVWGGALLFNLLFLKVYATVILLLFSFTIFSLIPSSMRGSSYYIVFF